MLALTKILTQTAVRLTLIVALIGVSFLAVYLYTAGDNWIDLVLLPFC